MKCRAAILYISKAIGMSVNLIILTLADNQTYFTETLVLSVRFDILQTFEGKRDLFQLKKSHEIQKHI
jgi:hypothetical protein